MNGCKKMTLQVGQAIFIGQVVQGVASLERFFRLNPQDQKKYESIYQVEEQLTLMTEPCTEVVPGCRLVCSWPGRGRNIHMCCKRSGKRIHVPVFT